ncbi:MAG: DUF4838 domain-containing protein [Lentisphaerae bacterium]|jgi:hypothetical protein|nr:DUF4838 domain-containing protein [Lentisphaerota bacterium]MBT5606704.1 DUF4838 domain-containing protein [Lentisphaerota bacterium]MBT7056993.1 DUF4838 domain-containing protein [Lentisphaerota bacterium]MBT7842076.1 DUF4838 domain-containing protein [Lentisphaerota bacterium]
MSYRNVHRSGLIAAFVACSVGLAAEADTIRIVEQCTAAATIVVADTPASVPVYGKKATVRDVAVVLQDYVGRVTGVRLPLVSETAVPENAGTLILVGDTQRGRALGVTPAGLPPEGYRIRSLPGCIAIVGETTSEGIDRSTAFGVYDFIERAAGVRWYFPGEIGTVIPNRDSLSIGPLDVTNAPHFEVRIGGVDHWQTTQAKAWHPAIRFGSHDGMVANHTHEQWHRLYGKTKPTIFAIREDGSRAITTERHATGQNRSYLCYSSPTLLGHYGTVIDGYVNDGNMRPWAGAAARPKGHMIPFGPNDNRELCLCPECKPRIDEERGRWGKGSDLIFGFVRRLAEQTKARHPDHVIWTLAYDHYQLPATDITEFPDNLGVTLCLIPTVVQMNHPGVRARNRQLIDDWYALVRGNRRRLVVWDYFCYPNYWLMAPTELPRTMKEHVNYLRDKALGIFNNGFSISRKPDPKAYLTLRMVWLMHQLLWNPDLDLDAARRDWCRDLFGPASQEMDGFYRILEDRWEDVVWSQEPKVGYVGENSVFAETYPAPVVQDLEGLLDKAQVAAASGSQYRKRLDWFRENCFGPFFQEARRFHAASGVLRRYTPTARSGKIRIDGNLDEIDWQKLPTLKLADRRLGDEAPADTRVMMLHDPQTLMIGAKLRVPEPAEMVAEALGPENLLVERDDMFLLHLQTPSGYTELAVNPNGSFSTQADVLRKRGFFPSHDLVPWDTRGVTVACHVADQTWSIEIGIPWEAVPGLDGRPKTLRAQVVRWCRRDKHHFHCWSPVLSSWDYPVSRFGRLVFHRVPTEQLRLVPAAEQTGRIAAVAQQPAQPTVPEDADPKTDTLIVGERDIGGRSWVEQRSVIIFDLSSVRGGPDAVAGAQLTVHHVNALHTPPYADIVVDHIPAANPSRVKPTDFASRARRASIGTILPGTHVGRYAPYSLDVTDCVQADLAAGLSHSAFRLRIVDGCACKDGRLHYSIFTSAAAKAPAKPPSLTIEHYQVE